MLYSTVKVECSLDSILFNYNARGRKEGKCSSEIRPSLPATLVFVEVIMQGIMYSTVYDVVYSSVYITVLNKVSSLLLGKI